MFNTVCQPIARFAHVLHPNIGDKADSAVAHSTGHETNLIVPQSKTHFTPIAEGDNEDPMETARRIGLQSARRDPGAVQLAAQRRRVHGEVPVLQQEHLGSSLNLYHHGRDDWRSKSRSYNALHYQQ